MSKSSITGTVANELRLVYADGKTLRLTETPIRQEEDAMQNAHLRLGLLEYHGSRKGRPPESGCGSPLISAKMRKRI